MPLSESGVISIHQCLSRLLPMHVPGPTGRSRQSRNVRGIAGYLLHDQYGKILSIDMNHMTHSGRGASVRLGPDGSWAAVRSQGW